jgi:hypothetical protein
MLIWFDIWQDSDEDDEKDNQLEPLLSIGQCIQFLEEHERLKLNGTQLDGKIYRSRHLEWPVDGELIDTLCAAVKEIS